jgi:glycerol kinase
MVFNIRDLQFDDELLSIFAIPRAILPDVLDSDAMFGSVDPSLFGHEIPVHGILGDQQASLFSHCGWKKGVVKNTYGTGLFIMTDTQENLLLSDKLVTTVAWTTAGTTNYALEGSVFMGGATMQWLRDRLGIIASADESEELARSIPDNEGVYFVPALQGLGAPYWRADARGIIAGLSRRANRATIVRAALEAMAYQTRDVIDEMKHLLDFKLTTLSVDGGACVNDFLMQYQSDILNLPVERPTVIERTALGTAGISGISAGIWSFDEFSEKAMTVERTFVPEMREELREMYYDGWKKAVAASIP